MRKFKATINSFGNITTEIINADNLCKANQKALDNISVIDVQEIKPIEYLKHDYEHAVMNLIELFCEKQECAFEFWIGEFGNIASFGDVMIFAFSDIYYDLVSNQKKGLIFDWLYKSIEFENVNLNYKSYTMGLDFETVKKK